MPTIAVLNQSGEKVKDLELSEAVFGVEINKQVVYDVVKRINNNSVIGMKVLAR